MAASRNAVIGLLRVLLSANTAEYEAAMKKSADSAKAWSRDLRQVGRQAQEVGMALTTTLTLPIAGVGIAAAKLAMDFESSFAGVRKTVDATEPQLAELAQGFRNLSKTIPVNVNDLNRLGEAAGALGIPRDKVVEFAAVMAKLGVSTNLTADQAADSIARIQNIFGAAGQDTERLASTLVALGNAGASTEKEIVEMAQRIAGAGNTVGMTQAQVLAFASTLASVGINAEMGGSAISRAFLKMNDAVASGGKALAEFARVSAMSAADFKNLFERDAAAAMQAFIGGLGRLKASGENINGTIEGVVGKSILLKDTLLRLVGSGQLLTDQLKIADAAWQSNTALAKEAGERFKTTHSQLLLLGNRVKDVGITLGNALGPSIDLALRGLNALIPVLEKAANLFAGLPPSMQAAIVAFAGLVAAAGPAVYILGQLALSGAAIAKAFAAEGLAMKALVGLRVALMSVGAAATGLSLPLAGVAAAFVGVRLATGSWWETLKVLAIPLYGTLELLGKLLDGLIPTEGVIADVASIIQDALVIGFRNLSWAMGIFVDGLKLIPSALATVGRALRDQLLAEVNRVIDMFGRALPQALKITLSAMAIAATAIPGAFAETKKAIHDAAIALDQLANGSAPRAKTSWSDLSNLLTGGFGPAIAGATGGTQSNTRATNENTEARAANVAMTSQQTQVQDLLAKAHAHEAARLDLETAAWKRWEQAVSNALATLKSNPVLLQGRNLSGIVPQVDAGGAGNLAGVKTGAGSSGPSMLASLFGSPQQLGQQLAATIVGAFQGGGNAVQAAVGQLGSSVASNFGQSLAKTGGPFFQGALGQIFTGALPVVGSLIGPLVGAIWGKLFGTAGRDTKLDLVRQHFGSVEEMQKQLLTLGGPDYNRLWKQFSEVGQNNKNQAIAAVDAIVKALDAQKRKQEEVAAAAKESADEQAKALDEIAAKYKTKLDEIDTEYKRLSDSVAKEAEEEHMGLTEALEREEMKRLEDKKRALEAERDAEIAAKKETFAETLTQAQELDEQLKNIFERGYKSPIRFHFPDGLPPVYDPSTLPAGATSGFNEWETQMPAGGGSRPIVIQNRLTLDGKVVARNQVTHMPDALGNQGL